MNLKKQKMYPYKFCPLCGTPLKKRKIEGKLRLWCPNCERTIYLNPVPVVAGVVFNKQNEVLLIKRGVPPRKGMWALPSGFIDIGEPPEKAVLRELEEETGFRGMVLKLLGIFPEKSPRYKEVLVIGYFLWITGGSLKPGDDAEEAGFFPLTLLPSIPFKSHVKLIELSHEIVKGRDDF